MSLKRVFQSNKGLTLIELLISISVISIILLVVVSILTTQNTSFKDEVTRNKLVTDTTQTLNSIQYLLLDGSSILSTITSDGLTYTTDSDTIILQLPSITVSGDVVANSYDTCIIDNPNDSRIIHLIVIPDASSSRTARDENMTTNVNDFVIRFDDLDVTQSSYLSITLELSEENSGDKLLDYSQTMTYDLRNA